MKTDEKGADGNRLTELERLQRLRDNGVSTETEFIAQKNKILDKNLE